MGAAEPSRHGSGSLGYPALLSPRGTHPAPTASSTASTAPAIPRETPSSSTQLVTHGRLTESRSPTSDLVGATGFEPVTPRL